MDVGSERSSIREVKRRVYIETSIVSYLASRPSRDVVSAGRQQLTHSWWEMRPGWHLSWTYRCWT